MGTSQYTIDMTRRKDWSETSLLHSLLDSCPARITDPRKRLPAFSYRNLVSTLRARVVAVHRTGVLRVKARHITAVDDAGSTTVLSHNALAPPVGTSTMMYVLCVAHYAPALRVA